VWSRSRYRCGDHVEEFRPNGLHELEGDGRGFDTVLDVEYSRFLYDDGGRSEALIRWLREERGSLALVDVEEGHHARALVGVAHWHTVSGKTAFRVVL
jgi:hypothetical protein